MVYLGQKNIQIFLLILFFNKLLTKQGGWYDKKVLEFKKIVDILFTAAMGIGRSDISARLLSNFNTIFINELDEQTLKSMSTIVLHWGYHNYVLFFIFFL